MTGKLSGLQVAGGGSGWRRWLSGDIIIPIIGLVRLSNLMLGRQLIILGMLGRLFIMLDSLRKDIIMRDVMAHMGRGRCWYLVLKRLYLAEKLPVPLCDGSGTINADLVTVVWAHFYDNTSLVPLAGVLATLVLYSYLVTSLEWLKRFTGM